MEAGQVTGMKVTSIILCGGKDRRFGGNKALSLVGGKRVIDRVLERLDPISSQMLIVTSPAKTGLEITPPVSAIVDLYPDKGPLGGIYTGLKEASSSYAIVVGCDMPFINTQILHRMVSVSSGFDAVIPRLDAGMIEPLHAIYAQTCAEEMRIRLDQNRLSITQLIREMNVRYLEKEEYLPLDPQMLSFFNINYQADLKVANELSARADSALARHANSSARFGPAPR